MSVALLYPIGFAAAIADVAGITRTGVDTVLVSATAGGGYARGWKWIYHFTLPSAETQFKLKFSDFTSAANSIPVANNIRFFSPQSSDNKTEDTAITIAGATATSSAMTLSGDTDLSASGRQIDVTVEVKIPAATGGGSYTATYDVESDMPPDTQAPVITLTGNATVDLLLGETYTEQGATATDDVDGMDTVTIGGAVSTSTVGTYTITYDAVDAAGNHATQVTRTVNVNPPPIFNVN